MIATPARERPAAGAALAAAARAPRPAASRAGDALLAAGSGGSVKFAPSACSRAGRARADLRLRRRRLRRVRSSLAAHLRPRLGGRRSAAGRAPAAVLALCVAYPYYVDTCRRCRSSVRSRALDTAFVMAIYVMMALGLNIVVGYAGLLDLGYVAFYAIGAYTAAWLASPQFADGWNLDFGGVGVPPGRRRHPHLDLARADRRRAAWPRSPASSSACRRCACAATTSRSSRSASARSSTSRANGDNIGRREHHERLAGDQPDRPAGLRHLARTTTSACRRTSSPRRTRSDCLLLGRARARAHRRRSARSRCATRSSAGPGSRSARTRPPPPRWASR